MEYKDNIVSVRQEQELVQYLDSRRWHAKGTRRVQSYGCRYDSATREVVPADPIEYPLDVLKRLVEDRYMIRGNIQCYVNEYTMCSGISDHIDPYVFGDSVAVVSLLDRCTVVFTHVVTGVTRRVHLEPRSILVFRHNYRNTYTHRIEVGEHAHPEYRRLSVTFRCVC